MYDFEKNHRFLKLTIEIVFSIVQLKKSEPDGSYPVAIILCLDACCVKQIIAAGQGLEPQYHPPEGRVLPLDDPAKNLNKICLVGRF